MARTTIGLPQGTRDFGPETVRKRNHIFNTIRTVFELYGFQPIETPAMENVETLTGKYGDEGDKLIFKILNNGLADPKNIEKAKGGFDKIMEGKISRDITERALRYDLTIPFARYVAMNFAQLVMPFKRYQIQPVWRADRPQKGRYREFYQCDADIVGSSSLINEIELTALYHDVFERLQISVEIRINNRKILAALAEAAGGAAKMTEITIAIDKLDKIGMEKVLEELETKGLNDADRSVVKEYLEIKGDGIEKLDKLKQIFGASAAGAKGLEELEYIINHLPRNVRQKITIDQTLARGLNYYTGIIFEVKANDVQMGSIGGGGRYDDLTGLFGVPNIPGVGISFGVDRIYDVMEELNVFPKNIAISTQVLFFNLGESESSKAVELMQKLRASGVRAEIYHEQAKFDRQFKYAEKRSIPFIIIIGTKELEEQSATIKDLRNGSQQSVSFINLLKFSFI